MAVELYIARHGQTEENVRRILQGQMPGHLTPEGIRQAEALCERLRDVHLDALVTSDLQRAVDTMRIIARPHGLAWQLEPLLRERDFGIHTGGPYIKISHALDPSAETIEQVAQRAACFLCKVQREHEGQSVLAVSHGLYLRVLQAVFHHADAHDIEKMENAEVRLLRLTPDMLFGTMEQETGGAAN